MFELVGDLAGVRLTIDTADLFQSQMIYGVYQRPVIATLKRLMRAGDTVLVAGAHIGYIPLVLANGGATVVCFEADPRNVLQCRENLDLNPLLPVTLVPEGLSNTEGNLRMWQSVSGTHSSFGAQHLGGAYVDVCTRRGDDCSNRLGSNGSKDWSSMWRVGNATR